MEGPARWQHFGPELELEIAVVCHVQSWDHASLAFGGHVCVPDKSGCVHPERRQAGASGPDFYQFDPFRRPYLISRLAMVYLIVVISRGL